MTLLAAANNVYQATSSEVAALWPWWQQALQAGDISQADFNADPTTIALQAFISNPNRSDVFSSLANAQVLLAKSSQLLYNVVVAFNALSANDAAPAYAALNKVTNAWAYAEMVFGVLNTIYDELASTSDEIQSYLAGK
ncbi:MAG: hypothetical protein WC700_04275 [Gemmatimonadaceae bacterium]|jgi:hypothetical protein